MPQPVLRIVLTDQERETLNAWSRSSAGEHRMVERSRVILLAAEGLSAREIARRLKTRLARVSKWRQRFCQHRLAGLEDAARPGKPKTYDEKTEKRILAILDANPPALAVVPPPFDPGIVELGRVLAPLPPITFTPTITSD